ncbi:MAG: acyl-CoA dehydrogenase [Alphaproteobacteria bacterium]|nr:acyl-CoA dehydrogenase [Alphaproteobacteria bacterium]
MNLADWIGRSETRTETIHGERLAALAATFDRDPPKDAVPPGWHWAFFNAVERARDLGRDGHPKRGGFLPPVALPRRMWAGGRLHYHSRLPVDAVATRVSRIEKVEEKHGKTGALVFVTVHHGISAEGALRLEEWHDIVYRADPDPAHPAPKPQPAPAGEDWSRRVVPDPVLLFRYSALTFNGHRIHYDRSYATDVEGYGGLVVHGPMVATMLQDLAVERSGRALKRFEFRAMSPLFDTHPFELCGRKEGEGAVLWARGPGGYLAMQARAEFAL